MTALEIGVDFVVAAGGGVLAGLVTFWVVCKVRRRIQDPVFDTAVSIVVPFAAYLLAEEIHASGVVAVVVAGLLLGHKAPIIQTAQSRLAERTIWRTVSWVLENTVFLLIGLQAQWLFADVAESEVAPWSIAVTCVATLVAVVVLRMLWVFVARYLLVRPGPDPETGRLPNWRYTFLLGWAGMRGVVTLAAAFVIPKDVADREILLLVAFTVVAGTLFLQGLSLPWLARRLRVPSPDPAADALARATLLHQATEAGLAVLDQRLAEAGDDGDPHDVGEIIRRRIEQRNFAVWEQLGDPDGDHETPTQTYSRLRLEMLEAERGRVLEVRSEGNVPAEVVSDVLAMLDVEESMLDVVNNDEDGRVGAGRRAARTWAACATTSPTTPRRRNRGRRASARTASRRAPAGCTCASASPAGRSGAATPRRSGTPPATSTARGTPSSSPGSRARTGAGASCTTSPGDQRGRTTSSSVRGSRPVTRRTSSVTAATEPSAIAR